ncbi:hypothetical protein KXS11_00020 [Plantibacter flavus]|uniref:hypothetical protein n=1 Tax=Plantibacter flavus TaxID=150123 RepID=UPI003F18A230
MSEFDGDQPAGERAPGHGAPRSTRRTVLIVAGVVVVVALIAVSFLLFRPGATPDAAASGSPNATSSASASPGATTPTGDASPSGDAAEPGTRPTDPPLAFDEDGEALPGVTVSVTKLTAVEGEASGVGEIAGPAVQVSITVKNGTDASLDLRTMQVTADAGADRLSSSELSGPGVVPFPSDLAAGDSATAVYVFGVAAGDRDVFRVFVDTVVTAPVLAFEGAAPPA